MKTSLLVPLLLVAAALGACSRSEVAPEPVRAVKLLKVGAGLKDGGASYAGEVRARSESRLGFRVGGKLILRPAEVGQRVAAGQVLAQLDPTDLALASQAAQAQVAAAQSQRDLAAADLRRFADLKAQGFVSSADIERRQTTLQAAEAALRQALAQGSVQGNQAAYARLQADAPGVVLAVEAEAGQVVAAGATVVRVARDGARDVVIAVPEDRLGSLRLGAEAHVRLWASGAVQAGERSATVREVAASADPVTRTFQVKLALSAGDQAPLGATATVRFPAPDGQVGALRLPTSAVMRATVGQGSESAVWVFDPVTQTVSPRSVAVAGPEGGELLITSGIKAGEEVVAAGVHVLSPGQKVVRFAGPSSE
jgi:membrane fusion protein, multidrug efflux system